MGCKMELEEPVTLTTQEEYPHLSKTVYFLSSFLSETMPPVVEAPKPTVLSCYVRRRCVKVLAGVSGVNSVLSRIHKAGG